MTVVVHLAEVVVDCAEPALLGRFYADLLDCSLHTFDEEWTWIEPATRGGGPADADGVRIAFQKVPEAKTGKVRLHLDLGAADIEATVERAIDLGASRLGDPVTDLAGTFVVLADPEGHEFCIVEP
ncbi:MAG: hypothetical protein K1X38_18565 [Microthrixaceae bacterium]|nr:hypothetical protein [Microthrixaceae bacterium]